MEPILPEPMAQSPVNEVPSNQPNQVNSISVSPETAPNTRPSMTHENLQPVKAPSQNNQQTAVQSVQPLPSPTNQQSQSNPIASDMPLIADDVDVIEKEWVDKAKKIVSATKDDPHAQEKEVSKLQADYLQKRYNKQLKLTE